jgi:putative redox protein
MPKVHVSWLENLKFLSEDPRNNKTFMEASPLHGGTGSEVSPMDLFLSALGGCAGVTIITMLKARGQTPDSMNMEIDGSLMNENPKFFEKINIRFLLAGDLKEEVVERVIRLTMTKLCPIAAMLGQVTKLNWEYELLKNQVSSAPVVKDQ